MDDVEKVALPQGPVITPVEALAAWLSSVKDGSWMWPRNTRCKYVTMKIDTRRGAYRIEDRDGNQITFDQLAWQYGRDYLSGEHMEGRT